MATPIQPGVTCWRSSTRWTSHLRHCPPTVSSVGRPCGDELLERLAPYAAIERLADAEALLARMAEPVDLTPGATGSGRIGLFTHGQAAVLSVDRVATAALLDASLSEGSRGA